MEKRSCTVDERWKLPNSTDNAAESRQVEEDQEEEEEEDDDEALSLSDLPLIHQSRKAKEEEERTSPLIRETHEDDFDFCSFSKESEMCTADQVFFQGQIIPLRHSISGSSHYSGRSESMDRCYSGRLISSRSSSISSHQSSTSGSSSSSSAAAGKPKLPPRNSFHSYPSPSPRLHFSTHNQSNHRNSVKIKSSVWNVLRLGLVTPPPEIAFKSRCPTSNNSTGNFGSRNSTSSNGSSIMSSSTGNSSRKKKNARARFLGGCKCSADAVDTVTSKVVVIKRSASENDVVEAIEQTKLTKKQADKKHMSHHRTFEWLKQLSVEA